jgi:uncharacterized membrane protein YccC
VWASLRTLAGVTYRPIGTARADRALRLLLVDVDRIAGIASHLPPASDGSTIDRALREHVTPTLRETGEILVGNASRAAPTDALEQARADHQRALAAAAAAELARGDPDAVLDAFDTGFPVRRMSVVTIALARNAAVACGDAPSAAADDVLLRDLTLDARPHAGTRSGQRLVGEHLSLHSLRFRNALRAALGLAAAVLLAKALDVQHGFWVVLGTLTVLRSNAIGTRRTAEHAVIGTLLGFGLAALLLVAIDRNTDGLWFVFPIAAFLAIYTPGAVNFVVGQACFTLLVVDLFNLVQPQGWRTGLVRVQDIALGAGISLLVGVVLWPRGAQGAVRDAFVELIQADSELLDEAVDQVARPSATDSEAPGRAQQAVVAARERAAAALEGLATERGESEFLQYPWATLLSVAVISERVAEGVMRHTGPGHGRAPNAALRDVVAAEGHRLTAALTETLAAARTPARARIPDIPTMVVLGETAQSAPSANSPELVAALASCRTGDPGDPVPLGVLWAHEWLRYFDRVLESVENPAAAPALSPRSGGASR